MIQGCPWAGRAWPPSAPCTPRPQCRRLPHGDDAGRGAPGPRSSLVPLPSPRQAAIPAFVAQGRPLRLFL